MKVLFVSLLIAISGCATVPGPRSIEFVGKRGYESEGLYVCGSVESNGAWQCVEYFEYMTLLQEMRDRNKPVREM